MKRTTINLEDDLMIYIDEYQKSKGFSSRSVTIQRILLKFQHLQEENDYLKMIVDKGYNQNSRHNTEIVNQYNNEKEDKKVVETEKSLKFKSSINNIPK